MTCSIRRFAPHEWRIYRELRLGSLAESPDAFGATLESERDHTDDKWSARLAAGADLSSQLPLLAEIDGRASGLAWGRIDPPGSGTARLYQVWVGPAARRCGTGRMLLEAFLEWARATGAVRAELRVTCGDTPAMRLYLRACFKPFAPPEPLRPGSSVLIQPLELELD